MRACLTCGTLIRVLGEEELFNSDLCCNECVAFLEATEKSPWGQRKSLTSPREKRKWSEKKTRLTKTVFSLQSLVCEREARLFGHDRSAREKCNFYSLDLHCEGEG